MNPQPTIFISSIISEFYDLRGALKYFLGKSGFRVLMSEEPDFGADCSQDSLDNCKTQIEKSDYFLLIIGKNPGSIFTIEGNETTVTKEEFKHYVDLIKNGYTIKLLAFVKTHTWDSYSNNRTDIHHLQFELIKELVENSLFDDLKIGRWRYKFEKFSDIISVLETNQNGLFLDATRKSTLYRSYIKRELTDIFRELLEKTRSNGEIKSITDVLEIPKIDNADFLTPIQIDKKTTSIIKTFCTVISSKDTLLRKINRVFNYVAQGEFSRFDASSEQYILPEYIKLTIQSLEILEKVFDHGKNIELYTEIKKRSINDFHIDGFEYWLVWCSFNDLKIVTTKLAVLMKCLHFNWFDLEKRPDEYYNYRGRAGENITDEELLKYATSITSGP